MRAALLMLGLALAPMAHAEDVWLTASVRSYHFDRSKTYNEVNQGLGLEVGLSKDWRAVAGAYRNSFSKPSAYLGAVYAPFQLGMLKVGLTGGVITGYEHVVSLALVPVLMLEGQNVGLNLLLMPKHGSADGGMGLQVKVRW